LREDRDMTPAMRDTLNRLRSMSSRLHALAISLDPSDVEQKGEEEVNDQQAMEQIIEDRFENSESRGWAWRPLKKPDHQPLVQTGALKEAARSAVAGTYRLDHSRIRWSVVDVRVHYAPFHQDGTATIPARPFFDPPSEEELEEADRIAAEAMDEFTDYLMERE